MVDIEGDDKGGTSALGGPPTLCERSRVPHPGHPYELGHPDSRSAYECPGWPEPGTAAGRAAVIIFDAVLDGLHGDASGLDDGVACAVAELAAAGLLAAEPGAVLPLRPKVHPGGALVSVRVDAPATVERPAIDLDVTWSTLPGEMREELDPASPNLDFALETLRRQLAEKLGDGV